MYIDITPVFIKRLPLRERTQAFDLLLLIPQQFFQGELEMIVVEGRRGIGTPDFKKLNKKEALDLLCASAPLAVEIYVVYGDFTSSIYRWRLRRLSGATESLELCLTAVAGDLDESRAKDYESIMRYCHSHGLCDGAFIDYSMWDVKRELFQIGTCKTGGAPASG